MFLYVKNTCISKNIQTIFLKTFITIQDTKNCLNSFKKEVRQGTSAEGRTRPFGEDSQGRGKTIGFVPTMGALHRGHIALLERAKRENVISVASIFVNPLQFNDKKDLEKYPRNLEKDSEMLKSAHCDVVFVPSVEEMYPKAPPAPKGGETGDVLRIFPPSGGFRGAEVMEGLHRPGHFQGVCVVVKKLFDIVEPTKAYFGEKDFQQLAVIKHMVKALKLPVEIVSCPTVREADGLAMSSRNTLLTAEERKNASLIFQTLQEVKTKWKGGPMEYGLSTFGRRRTEGWKNLAEKKINENPYLKLEYFEIVNSETLEPITDYRPDSYREQAVGLRACIAVKVGAIRLIDNIPL